MNLLLHAMKCSNGAPVELCALEGDSSYAGRAFAGAPGTIPRQKDGTEPQTAMDDSGRQLFNFAIAVQFGALRPSPFRSPVTVVHRASHAPCARLLVA